MNKPNILSILMGLAIAALIQLSTFSRIFNLLINVFDQIFFQLPAKIMDGVVPVYNQCGGRLPSPDCLVSATPMVSQDWENFGKHLIIIFKTFPFADFLTFLIIWMFSTLLLQFILQHPSTQWRSWLTSSSEFFGGTLWKNVMFFAIIFIGGYFSLASITAIPMFQQKTQVGEPFSADSLSQQLQAQIDQLEELFPEIHQTDNQFVDLEDWISSERATIESYKKDLQDGKTISEEGTEIDQAFINRLESRIGSVTYNLGDQKEKYNNMITDGVARRGLEFITLNKAKDEAIQYYLFAVNYRVGVYENADYYIALANWFNDRISNTNSVLGCYETLQKNAETKIGKWSKSYTIILNAGLEPSSFQIIQEGIDYGLIRCTRERGTGISLPRRKDFGASISGPFGLLAGWLLKTESYSLALITGMVGFGLLGAAGSTVIREKEKAGIASNLSGIVIRGTLAAVVVFLAAQGGLAIFVQGDAELNPYAVLLTCLVGAVYGEDVWKWAKGLLEEQIKKLAESAEVVPEEESSPQSTGKSEAKLTQGAESQEEVNGEQGKIS